MRHNLARSSEFLPQLSARFRLAIQRLSDGRGPAHFAQNHNFHLKLARRVLHVQKVADMDLPRRLRQLSVGLNSAELARLRGKAARLKKAGGPEPFVDSHTS